MIVCGMDLRIQKVKAALLKDSIVVVQGQAYSGFNPTTAAKTAFDAALKQLNLQPQDIECSATSGLRFRPYSCRWATGGIFLGRQYTRKGKNHKWRMN